MGESGDRQAQLEARAESLSAASMEGRKNLRDVFGDVKEWALDVGPYRFLLIPFLREWWFYDTYREEWRFTGRRMGEARFIYDGQRLVIQELAPAKNAAHGEAVRRCCSSCGASAVPEWNYCPSCGRKLPQAQR